MSVQPTPTPARSAPGTGLAAFYDLDGTLADCDVTHAYLYYVANLPGVGERVWRLAAFALQAPAYFLAEMTDRSLFNERFFAAYAGMSRDRLEDLAESFFNDVLRPRL